MGATDAFSETTETQKDRICKVYYTLCISYKASYKNNTLQNYSDYKGPFSFRADSDLLKGPDKHQDNQNPQLDRVEKILCNGYAWRHVHLVSPS